MVDVPDKNAPFRNVIDSTVMLTLARFGTPAVMGIIGYFVVTTLTDLKSTQHDAGRQIAKIADSQSIASAMQSGLSVKVDGAVKQLDHLQMQVDGLPRR